MAWECKVCHRSISLDPDPRGCDDEPICWHCLYELREALLEFVEAVLNGYYTSYRPEDPAGCQMLVDAATLVAEAKGKS